MRRAARVDRNHSLIRTALQRVGCQTLDTFTLGRGAPDLICSFIAAPTGQRITFGVEVKDGELSPSRQKLTEDQESFHHSWKGLLYIVNKASDVPGVVKQAARDSCSACERAP